MRHSHCSKIGVKIFIFALIFFLVIPLYLIAEEQEDFSIAKKFYDDELYTMAIDSLKTFIEKYPDSSFVGDAHSWLGETLIKEKHFNFYSLGAIH